jgi:hypothetical protein
MIRAISFLLIGFALTARVAAIDPPPAAMKLLEEFKTKEKAAKAKLEADIADLRAKAAKDLADQKKLLVAELEKVKKSLEAEEKHNEARAVAARIRTILSPPIHATPGPSNLTAYAAQVDKSFIFRVTGRTAGGSIWGTDVYTSDSDLARASVHMGLLADGETGLVKVTIVTTAGSGFTGSERNGVATSAYGEWPTGYRVERVTAEEAEGVIEAEDPSSAVTIEGVPPVIPAIVPSPPPGTVPSVLPKGRFRDTF